MSLLNKLFPEFFLIYLTKRYNFLSLFKSISLPQILTIMITMSVFSFEFFSLLIKLVPLNCWEKAVQKVFPRRCYL